MARTSGQIRATANLHTGGIFLVPGRYAKGTMQAVGCRGDQAAVVRFGGADADDKVFNFWIWTRRESAEDEVRELYGSGTFTLGTAVGAIPAATGTARNAPRDDEKMADLLTFTRSNSTQPTSGPAMALETAMGSPGAVAHSPGDNSEALLVIPDLLNVSGIEIEISCPTDTAHYGFAIVETMSASA